MKVYFDKTQNKYFKIIGQYNLQGFLIDKIKEISERDFNLGLELGIYKN